MKKFLKIASIVLVIAIVACFAACGNNADVDTDNGGSADAPKAVLTMATNAEFPPYEYVEGDKIVGIDA